MLPYKVTNSGYASGKMNITVTGFSGYSSFTCNSWVAEKCLGRKTNFLFSLLEFFFSLFEIFSHFHVWVFVFLSHLSLLFFWYCILLTCCYLLRFRLFLSASLSFFRYSTLPTFTWTHLRSSRVSNPNPNALMIHAPKLLPLDHSSLWWIPHKWR